MVPPAPAPNALPVDCVPATPPRLPPCAAPADATSPPPSPPAAWEPAPPPPPATTILLAQLDVSTEGMTPPAPVTVASANPVRVYVNFDVVGNDVIVYVPSNDALTPATITEVPTANPCAVEVVTVARPFTNVAEVIEIPRRISDAPPPPNPGAVPLAPPFQPPVEDVLAAPTNMNKTSPGVTGTTASTRPPSPAANVVAPALAPIASTCND